jgi:murein DD-endopeptidase MepM/ murein hydrolase activator NlpD
MTASADTSGRPTSPPEITEGTIRRGQPFFVAMQRAGVSPVDIQEIVSASKAIFNFKKVQPGQEFSIYKSAGLDSLHFTIDSQSILKVTKTGDVVEARRDTVPYLIEHYVTSSAINSSIYLTLQENKADPELASHLAIIFQWDIDFFKDIRKGDTFTILYEKKTFADGRTELGNVRAARIFSQGREHYAIAYRNQNGTLNYYDAEGKSLQKSLLRAPLRYSRISSNFTYKRRHPVTHTYRAHLGVDYVAPVGTPVRSTGTGTVLEATYNRSNGNYVKIRHNSRYQTYYLHMKGFARGIRKGARVTQGQVIGYLGGTGLATAPHLDYRIKVDGRFVNPRTIRLPSKEPVPKDRMDLFEITRDGCLLRFFEAGSETPTVAVRRPTPPMQDRIAPVF